MCHQSWLICFGYPCGYALIEQIVPHISVSHIVFFYVLMKTMIDAMRSSKNGTEFKIDPDNHALSALNSLVTAIEEANTSIVSRRDLRSRNAIFLYSKCLEMSSVYSVKYYKQAQAPC